MKSPKRSTTNPSPIKAMDVRCHASSVRSAAKKTRGSSRYDIRGIATMRFGMLIPMYRTRITRIVTDRYPLIDS
jgi:hypothetical protein